MNLPLLKNAKVEGKTVLLRLDLDVPLTKTHRIIDDTRLNVGLDTLKYLLHRGAFLVVVGHLGRPKGKEAGLSLKPVVDWICDRVRKEPGKTKIGKFDGWHLANNLSIIENIRFYPGEETNDPKLSRELADLAEIYVNDAFDTCHRNHASVAGVAALLPHFAGLRLELEIAELSEILENPKRPLCIIVGGAKIETKLPLIEKMHDFADYILVGGKVAQETRELLRVQHEKTARRSALLVADLNQNQTDITPNTLENFIQIIGLSKTIIWNGPLGIIENSEFKTQEARAREADSGTQKVAEAIIKHKVYSIAGGGDTVGFLRENGLLDSFRISTGGGAMLSFLAGEKLPGIEALLK